MLLGLGTPRVKPHTDPVLSKSVKVTYRVVGVTGSAAIQSLSRKWVLPLAMATTTGLPKVEPPSVDFDIEISDRKSTRLNSSHVKISYAVFCLKKKKKK